MSTTAVGRCVHCQAVVNVHWHSCLVCKAILPAAQETKDDTNPSLAPGSVITWFGSDGKLRGPGTVDFLHTDAERAVWAFVTLADASWVALNLRYVRLIPQHERSV